MSRPYILPEIEALIKDLPRYTSYSRSARTLEEASDCTKIFEVHTPGDITREIERREKAKAAKPAR